MEAHHLKRCEVVLSIVIQTFGQNGAILGSVCKQKVNLLYTCHTIQYII